MNAHASRRQFLKISAAAAAGATFFDLPRLLAEGDSKSYYGGWPIGIQSYTLRNFSVLDAIRHMEKMGLRYVEFYRDHLSPDADDAKIAEMKQILNKAGIKITAHGVNGFSKDHEANKKYFDFARRAGFKCITADPSPDSFDSLDKLVAEYDVRIAIHNHGPNHRYDKLTDVTKAVKDRHPLIGACVDTGHVLRSNEDPVKWTRELGPRVFALHIKDVKEKQDRTENVVIGKGFLDVVGIFKALKEIKFPADGSISLEYESNPDNPIEDVQQCLVEAKAAIAKAAG